MKLPHNAAMVFHKIIYKEPDCKAKRIMIIRHVESKTGILSGF